MRKTIALLLCSAALSGCGGGGEPTSSSVSAPPPPGKIVVVNHGLDVNPQDESSVLSPTALKPDETALAVNPPLQEGVPQPLTNDQQAAIPEGEADRIALLEKEVAALRADYNSMMPAFNGLITTNERIKTLLDQLEQKAGMTAPVKMDEKPAASAAPASAPQAAAPAAPTTGAVMVSGLRVGEHGDKTRLVFDVSALTDYKTNTNNAEKTLLVTLPSAGWSGKESVDGIKSTLVSGWTVMAAPEGGTVVAIRLKKEAKVIASERLKAEGTGTARIVLDIAADKPAS